MCKLCKVVSPTKTDLVQAVAEAKCVDCAGTGLWDSPDTEHPEPRVCDECGGNGLRWPTLSREPRYSYDGGPTRVPDATLEKVLELLAQRGSFKLQYFSGSSVLEVEPAWGVYQAELDGSEEYPPPPTYATHLEAACATLLRK